MRTTLVRRSTSRRRCPVPPERSGLVRSLPSGPGCSTHAPSIGALADTGLLIRRRRTHPVRRRGGADPAPPPRTGAAGRPVTTHSERGTTGAPKVLASWTRQRLGDLVVPFRHRDIRLLWGHQQVASEIGDWSARLALAYLVLERTGSPAARDRRGHRGGAGPLARPRPGAVDARRPVHPPRGHDRHRRRAGRGLPRDRLDADAGVGRARPGVRRVRGEPALRGGALGGAARPGRSRRLGHALMLFNATYQAGLLSVGAPAGPGRRRRAVVGADGQRGDVRAVRAAHRGHPHPHAGNPGPRRPAVVGRARRARPPGRRGPRLRVGPAAAHRRRAARAVVHAAHGRRGPGGALRAGLRGGRGRAGRAAVGRDRRRGPRRHVRPAPHRPPSGCCGSRR